MCGNELCRCQGEPQFLPTPPSILKLPVLYAIVFREVYRRERPLYGGQRSRLSRWPPKIRFLQPVGSQSHSFIRVWNAENPSESEPVVVGFDSRRCTTKPFQQHKKNPQTLHLSIIGSLLCDCVRKKRTGIYFYFYNLN